MLISTNQCSRIEELVELEVGEKTFSIRVKELGLSDNSGASKVEMRQSKVGIGVYQLSESLSESSSEEVEKSSPILNKGVDGMSSETFNVECFGNEFYNNGGDCNQEDGRQLEVDKILGGSWAEVASKKHVEPIVKGPNDLIHVDSLIINTDPLGVVEKLSNKAVEDVSYMGLLPLEGLRGIYKGLGREWGFERKEVVFIKVFAPCVVSDQAEL
ncbi:hypothetical protein V6N12_029811 [Hibiscus sabdariffa]|uniref:Uncharacterized protein n=1 Tax=Hibiscus sabdariffa TaxID=183260 RepID=A0ABR2CX73_9ROSI